MLNTQKHTWSQSLTTRISVYLYVICSIYNFYNNFMIGLVWSKNVEYLSWKGHRFMISSNLNKNTLWCILLFIINIKWYWAHRWRRYCAIFQHSIPEAAIFKWQNDYYLLFVYICHVHCSHLSLSLSWVLAQASFTCSWQPIEVNVYNSIRITKTSKDFDFWMK